MHSTKLTNNSIEGNIPLFSAKKTSNNNDFAVSFGPLHDQTLTNETGIWLMMRLTTCRHHQQTRVLVLHSFSTNADIATILWQKFVDKPAKYIKPI